MCSKTGPPFGSEFRSRALHLAHLPMQGSVAEFFSDCCSNSLFSNTSRYLHFKDFYFHSGFKSFVSFLWTTCFAMRQKCESTFYLVVISVASKPRPYIKFSSASATASSGARTLRHLGVTATDHREKL